LPVVNVTKAHARAFRDTLIKVPKALPGKVAKLPLPELLKRDLSGFPQRSAQTVNKSLNLLGGILARAERDGFFDALPGWTNPFRVTLEIAASEKEPSNLHLAEVHRARDDQHLNCFRAGAVAWNGIGAGAPTHVLSSTKAKHQLSPKFA
jgi:hypothetical protein